MSEPFQTREPTRNGRGAHKNDQSDMAEAVRIAKQVVKGLPYLQKELGRRLSMQTGHVLATPSTYYVIFSGRCNLSCTFCTIWREVEPILTREQMLSILQQTKELSGSGYNISLSGGEPTIFKPLYETLETAQKLGINFGFTTNALALTKNNIQRILSYDPFNINVSLESIDHNINESLRPAEHGTKRTMQAIDDLVAEKLRVKSRVSIIVKPTIMEQNYRGLPDLVRHFGKEGPVQVNFQPYVGKSGDPFWVQDKQQLRRVLDEIMALRDEGYRVIGNDHQFEGFYEYLCDPPTEHMRHLDLGGHKRNCDIGLRSMFVYPSGDVYFCDFLKKPIGNIHKNTLKEIYYGETADQQRHVMVRCNIDCQQTCKRPIPLLTKARTFLRMG